MGTGRTILEVIFPNCLLVTSGPFSVKSNLGGLIMQFRPPNSLILSSSTLFILKHLGKSWSYKVLNSKIIESRTNCLNEWGFCLVLYFMSFNLNYMTQIPNSSQDVVVYGTINNTTLNYVSIPYQRNLLKTSKHWGSFLSHCKVSNDILYWFKRSY